MQNFFHHFVGASQDSPATWQLRNPQRAGQDPSPHGNCDKRRSRAWPVQYRRLEAFLESGHAGTGRNS